MLRGVGIMAANDPRLVRLAVMSMGQPQQAQDPRN